MLQELGNVLSFVILAAIVPPVILFLGRLVRPRNPSSEKAESYECGELPQGSAYVMFNNRFYLVAIVFLIFDVEIALLFPVLVLFKDAVLSESGLNVLLLAFGFLFILFLGLVYEWKKGDIDWVRQ